MIQKIGRQAVLFFMALLPWSVIISVFGDEQLGIGIFRFWKEIVMGGVFVLCCFDVYKKKNFTYDILDGAIVLYMVWLVIVSFFNDVPLVWYVYGLRYDAEFLCAFLIFRRVIPHWGISFHTLIHYFLISGGVMLIMSLLIRFVFGEMILTLAGFSDRVSVWEGVGTAPPIYHGIPGASVVRFQGMLEGPNQMAFFLITYMGMYASCLLFRWKKYYFMNTIIFALLLFFLLITYSRSGYIAVFAAWVSAYVLSIWGKKKTWFSFSLKKLISTVAIGCFILFVLAFQFGSHADEIFGRHASTSGHFERMYIGLLRFAESPFGSGLAASWPASRVRFDVNEKVETLPENPEIQSVVKKLKERNEDFVYTSETYYIPESWYIQQLVESGIIGLLLLLTVLLMIIWRVRTFPYVLWAFIGVLIMNIFLHSFESMHSSLILFILLSSLVPHQKYDA